MHKVKSVMLLYRLTYEKSDMNRVSNYTFVYRDSIFYSALNYNVDIPMFT
jgi:hypothetical protein